MPTSTFSITGYLKYLLLALPILVSFGMLNKYALDLPIWDDYFAILDFLVKYKGANGLDKWAMLFSQHNEHRILSSRLVYVVYSTITGHVNFRDIIFIGNLQLVGVYVLAVAFIRRTLPTSWFVPAFICGLTLFDLNNWENADFAMGSMQNFGIILLFFATIWLYDRNTARSRALAVLVQVLCIFSSGNGIIAAGCALFFNILNRNRPSIIVSLSTLAICGCLYFYKYNFIHTGDQHFDIEVAAYYFFRFVGAILPFPNYNLACLAGSAIALILILLAVLASKTMFAKRNFPILATMAFVLASMLMTTVFRSGLSDWIPSRYFIYTHLLVACLVTLLVQASAEWRLQKIYAGVITVLFLVVYNINYYAGRKDLKDRYDIVRKSEYYNFPAHKPLSVSISQEACELGIYCINEHR